MRDPKLKEEVFVCVCQKVKKTKILSPQRKRKVMVIINNILQYSRSQQYFTLFLKIKVNVDTHFSDLLGGYEINLPFCRFEVVAANAIIVTTLNMY